MSQFSNHETHVIDACRFNLSPAEEADVLAGAPESPEPTEEEINALGEAAGQLLTEGGDTILDILPESAPSAADRKVASPTDARPPRKPRQKPDRSVRLLSRTHGMYELPDTATVEISLTMTGPRIGTRTDTFRYVVVPIPASFGRGFQVTRDDTGETYAVNLNGRESSCKCRGHLRHGGHSGRFCKHIDGLQALVNAGKL